MYPLLVWHCYFQLFLTRTTQMMYDGNLAYLLFYLYPLAVICSFSFQIFLLPIYVHLQSFVVNFFGHVTATRRINMSVILILE